MENELKLFEGKKIRSNYDENAAKWKFSVIDVVSILIENIGKF